MKSQKEKKLQFTKEPNISRFKPLDSDVYEDNEYYIYKDNNNNTEYLRRKIGGWVNVSKFLPLLTVTSDVHALETQLRGRTDHHYIAFSSKNERFSGLWISLKDARKFAKDYEIQEQVAVILDFERLAVVNYSGVIYWEFFASTDVNMNIRILREMNSLKINMRQIFVFYNKLKGDKVRVPLEERKFYNTFRAQHVGQFSEKNDHTLCGGFWVPYDAAKAYCRKHGLFGRLRPIMGFIQSPDEAAEFHVDVNQGYLRKFWIAVNSNSDFYGFPESFSGGGAPSHPSKRIASRRNAAFSVTELVQKKRVTTDITQQHKSKNYTSELVRRLSDGWINGSSLVHIGCLLRVKALDFGKDDPVMVKLNELYYRDVVQALDCEPVANPRAKAINGFWISGRDARSVLKSLMIESSELYLSVKEFLDDTSYELEDDNDDDDHIDILNEEEYAQATSHVNIQSTDPARDKSCVESGSSDEESVQAYDNKDKDQLFNSEDKLIHEAIEAIDNSDDEKPFNCSFSVEEHVKKEPTSQVFEQPLMSPKDCQDLHQPTGEYSQQIHNHVYNTGECTYNHQHQEQLYHHQSHPNPQSNRNLSMSTRQNRTSVGGRDSQTLSRSRSREAPQHDDYSSGRSVADCSVSKSFQNSSDIQNKRTRESVDPPTPKGQRMPVLENAQNLHIGPIAFHHHYKPQSPPRSNFKTQKLLNKDELAYEYLKLAHPEKKEERDHYVMISSGSELTDLIFNNELVKRSKNLARLGSVLQRRQDLMKKRRALSTGLIGTERISSTRLERYSS